MALTAMGALKLKSPGYHGDGNGLWLQVGMAGSKSWIYRFTSPVTRKAREMGLGSLVVVSLAEARALARQHRRTVHEGRDPIEERRAERRDRIIEHQRSMTFDQCAAAYIEAQSPGWKSVKHAMQWESTLNKYVSPVFGKWEIQKVDVPAVLQALEPIWLSKNETASRIRGRIETILDWATVRKYRFGDNPARWKGHLNVLLAAPAKVQRSTKTHHAALRYSECASFMADLRTRSGMSYFAIEFAVFTAARSGEVRLATWDEVDFDAGLWTIPAKRMKAAKEHRVPLSSGAFALLRMLSKSRKSNLIFPGTAEKPLSNMSLTAGLRQMGHLEITVHGFRSTFRDWAGETTAYPREVIEHALAHQLKDKAEAAYQRGDLLRKRELLMQDWCAHLEGSSH